MPNQPHKILLFDGVCNLCNNTVLFVIKRDPKKQIRFGAIQSQEGKKLLQKFAIDQQYLGSLIFIDEGKVYLKSSGALRLSKYLSGLWPLLYALMVIPAFIRNPIYDFVAANRYKWFGKKEVCMIPTPELKSLFLNDEN
ncbi:MAG: thiol-disulfide oxidoreductase DCC family protein [Bacteroidota bacterium]|jgi:predicted DCC family thiol-disulfide oxidoreductase YuxK